MERPPKEDKARHEHLESSQLLELQIPKHQHKNINIGGQNNMLPPEPRNPSTEDPEKCNTAETQDKEFKTSSITMFKGFKDNTDKSYDDVYGNKQLNRIMKKIYNMKTGFNKEKESLKKMKIEVN